LQDNNCNSSQFLGAEIPYVHIVLTFKSDYIHGEVSAWTLTRILANFILSQLLNPFKA